MKYHSFFFPLTLAVTVEGKGSRRLPDIDNVQNYEPKTIVSDYAALDLDFHLLRAELGKERNSGFKIAQRVYQEGTFSRPVAELILDNPLDQPIEYDTEIVGSAYNGKFYSIVRGETYAPAYEGDTVIQVVYTIDEDQDDYVDCMVGANPDPVLDGCFATNGTISIPSKKLSLEYSYDVIEGNFNHRSFQVESLYSRQRLWECENCPKPDYKKFVDYYGLFDYADHMVVRGFQGGITDFQNGNQDFRGLGFEGRKDVIERALVNILMWMEVVSRMERAIDFCLDEDEMDEISVTFWDSSVAFYAGSTASGEESGVFLFHTAESRCISASTCGTDGTSADGTAWVNHEILQNFQAGQAQIVERNCEAARRRKEEIVRLMSIPAIQGALRYAYLLEQEATESRLVEGAMYAAGMLPLIHACNSSDAQIIHDNLGLSTTRRGTDFEAVRDAVARNLICLEMECDELGDVLRLGNDENGYCDGSWAAANQKSEVNDDVSGEIEKETSEKSGIKWFYGLVPVAAVVILLLGWKSQSSRQPNIGSTGVIKGSRDDEEPATDWSRPAGCNTMIEGKDYVPKCWQDCRKTDDDESSPSHLGGDNSIAGEML